MSKPHDPFVPLDANDLNRVAGGAVRTSASAQGGGTNSQLAQMLQQIQLSMADLGKNQGMDPMMMMMMMMMMGGGGGGGGGYPMAPSYGGASTPTYVQVTADGGLFGGHGGGGYGCCKGW